MSTAVEDPRIIEFDVRTDEMLVNMGPQHPSTHGVLRLVLRTDGEIVSEVVPHIGYLHRCAEKIGEKCDCHSACDERHAAQDRKSFQFAEKQSDH